MNPDRLLSLPGSPSDIVDEENNEFQLNKINVSYLKAMQTLILKSELKASIIFDPDIELVQDLQPGDLPPIDTLCGLYNREALKLINTNKNMLLYKRSQTVLNQRHKDTKKKKTK